MYNHAKSARFEAVVDSGSPWCLFHASIGTRMKIDVLKGIEMPLGGVVHGATCKAYFHRIKVCFPGNIIEVTAGFSPSLSVGGILGRSGFFDNYTVTFDPCYNPPGIEIMRVGKA